MGTETEAATGVEKAAAHPTVGAVGRRLTAATHRPTPGGVERCVPLLATQPQATAPKLVRAKISNRWITGGLGIEVPQFTLGERKSGFQSSRFSLEAFTYR